MHKYYHPLRFNYLLTIDKFYLFNGESKADMLSMTKKLDYTILNCMVESNMRLKEGKS